MSTTTLFAQSFNDLECFSEYTNTPNWCDEEFTMSVDPVYLDSFDPVVFNITFWRIVRDNGNPGPNHINENDALLAIANINKVFNPYKIFFKYRGFNDIRSTEIYEPASSSDISDWLDNYSGPQEEVENPNSLNMYTPYTIGNGGGGSASLYGTRSNITRSLFTTWGMIHELGHNMGLVHPFSFYTVNPVEECEHVTRNAADPNYNADTHGDRVTDTAATLILRSHNTNAETCLYEGNDQDCTEQTDYQIFSEDVRNYMNYVPEVAACDKIFSIGQAIRMREAIDINCYNKYDNVMTTDLSSLYEPYQGVYPLYYPWPGPSTPPLFQPGFEYNFIECCCDYQQPAIYGDTTFSFDPNNVIKYVGIDETNYTSIYHPNHTAISITQIDIATGVNQVKKCYDNYYTPPVIGGSIILFNDNVFNSNVTITPQDSTSINNPQLIDNLQPRLYNIIEQYDHGGMQETVIYKENN